LALTQFLTHPAQVDNVSVATDGKIVLQIKNVTFFKLAKVLTPCIIQKDIRLCRETCRLQDKAPDTMPNGKDENLY